MTHLRHYWILLVLSFCCILPAQSQTPAQLSQLDPSDIYFQAWLHIREAKKLEEQKKHLAAFEKYQEARTLFDTIAVNHPSYKPELVKGRQETTRDSLEDLQPKALAEQKAQERRNQEFIEGSAISPPTKIVPKTIDRSLPDTRNIDRLQDEISKLKNQLANAINDRDAQAAKLRRTIQELEAEKSREASAAVLSQLNRYKKEITELRHENQALSRSLSETRMKYKQSLEQLQATQQALDESRKEIKRLEAVVKEQGNINSRVIKGQQDQIDEIRREMEKKDQLQLQAQAEIKELKLQLSQSQNMMAELQEERDSLVKERDHMATLLKMNSGDRIQQLINQNVSLSKELNEAKNRVDLLMSDDAATKDKLIEAKNQLVIAKHKILNLQKENKANQLNVFDLKKRLATAKKDLIQSIDTENLSAHLKHENQSLLDIIKKQQAHIEMQEQTGRLLLEQAERMGREDKIVAQAVDQFEGTFKPALTEEEEQIIEDAGSDFILNNKFRPGEEERRIAGRNLENFKNSQNRVASRLFAKKDYQASRGIFEMIIEEDPGAWQAMIHLGIIQMNLKNPGEAAAQFNQAILVGGDRQIPFAHFQLGTAYKKIGLLSDAEKEFRTAIKLDPHNAKNNAKAHVFLGNIAGSQGRLTEAELSFKEALKINPRMFEPELNLARLFLQRNQREKALIHYKNALSLGAPPDLPLEENLQKAL